MNWSWFSFVVGLLVGWLIEWLIDYLFWRRKHRAQQAEIEGLQRQLEDAQARLREQEAEAAECAQALEACRAELEAAQAPAYEAEPRAAETIPLDLEAEEEEDAYATREIGAVVLPPEGEGEAEEKQDLTRIEGIGPKTQELLNEAGIVNYAQLAATPVSRLEEILDAAGPRYRLAVPTTWPQQAHLAADGRWDELQVLQASMDGGIIVKHDLTRIEGIGPKIQGLLNEAEIVNYNQLAATPVSRLDEILDAAGPRYRLANPSTWAEQARLAADGDWDALAKYQADLIGGRVEKEDLTVIEGIGPKIEGLLNEAGIINHWQLADTPVSRLEEILDAAGPSYRMADPSTWPEQSRLADEKKWDELQALQDRITAGRAEEQDLTKIEGIGPKIADLLREAGILNYALLADAPVERLREVLAAAGSTYATADPSTWPQQARLAAADEWDELKDLQDRLSGGREADEAGSE